MIDIHAHILPGIDDGAPDLMSALGMAELAADCGVTAVAATPHSNLPGHFENRWDDGLKERLAAFQREVSKAGIPLKIFAGMEIFGTPDVARLLEKKVLIPLNGSRYPLIEFPFTGNGREATEILESVARLGYRPIVAHPERYRYVQMYPELLNRWVDMGCLLQLNRGSLLGRFGRTAEALSLSLLDRGFVHLVASDAHSPMSRTTYLRDVWDLIREEYSADTARLLLEDTPRRVLENDEIEREEPEWF